MDFSNADIPKFLKTSIGNRFNDVTPQDFEDFISQLFKDNGYKINQTPYSGDYGADVLIEKDGRKTAIQVKNYAEDNKVGVGDINQIIGAKSYYSCDDALIVTTSEFTKRGMNLADTTGVVLWDWDRLLKEIGDLYWDSQDYYSYYKSDLINTDYEKKFSFSLASVTFNKWLDSQYFTIIEFEISNISNEHLVFNLLKSPVFIDSSKSQIQSLVHYLSSEEGRIYSGCIAKLSIGFNNNEINNVLKGNEIVFEISGEDYRQPSIYFYEFDKDFISKSKINQELSITSEGYIEKRTKSNIDYAKVFTVIGKALLGIIVGIGVAFVWVMSVLLTGSNKK